jgi:hypothetical protein
MQARFLQSAKRIVSDGVDAAMARARPAGDCRDALCRWEDELFSRFRDGIVTREAAARLVAAVFEACGRTAPALALVAGFDDPRIGGFADVARHRILIEEGCLYRFLILHESAHLLVPGDRRHGPAFIYVLQALYRGFIGVPEAAIRESLIRFGLPSYTALPAAAAPARPGVPIAA